ncbi:MAG: N-acetyl-gamma-glutamyl-phosphate reductase, partial [Pseudomonadota bacterium]
FTPAVGNFAQGMLVEVPLPLWSLSGEPGVEDICIAWRAAYRDKTFIRTQTPFECKDVSSIEPETCNGTNRLELFVFGTDEQARLIARLDNLGKGASGAAVQNLNLVLGVDEATGLEA